LPQVKPTILSKLPIRAINFENSEEKSQYDQMVSLVNQMLAMNKKLTEAKTPQAKNVLQRQIEATDKQIDQLVYELYNLTEEEIKIVESGT
jgi:CII-binding regulator of phage lambda lysogenization HflD